MARSTIRPRRLGVAVRARRRIRRRGDLAIWLVTTVIRDAQVRAPDGRIAKVGAFERRENCDPAFRRAAADDAAGVRRKR
jgi:hypothetical protein